MISAGCLVRSVKVPNLLSVFMAQLIEMWIFLLYNYAVLVRISFRKECSDAYRTCIAAMSLVDVHLIIILNLFPCNTYICVYYSFESNFLQPNCKKKIFQNEI